MARNVPTEPPAWAKMSTLSVEARALYHLLYRFEAEGMAPDLVQLSVLLRLPEENVDLRIEELVAFSAPPEGSYLPNYEPPPGYTGPRSLGDWYAANEPGYRLPTLRGEA